MISPKAIYINFGETVRLKYMEKFIQTGVKQSASSEVCFHFVITLRPVQPFALDSYQPEILREL